jgi:hypothetical protein
MTMLQTIPGFGFSQQLQRTPVAIASLLLAATVLLVGCASAPSESQPMVDPQARFGDYKTYDWYTNASTNDPSEPASIMDTSIRAAIATELQRKGYVEAPPGSTADLLIDYEAARTEKVKSNPFRIGIGVGGYGSSGGGSISTSTPSSRNVIEGSLVVHAVDPALNAEVWRSRISRELGKGSATPELVHSVVAEVLSDFPAHTATP